MKNRLQLLILFTLCIPPLGAVTPVSNHNKVIYEVNVRNFSPQGNFNGVTSGLPHLKELGVDILWLMPIHPIGEQNRVGVKGSPYAVKDYLAVNPDYGTAGDLKNLIAAAHNNGMEVWLDWVANHTAWDHVWTAANIDYYASSGGTRPYSPMGWNDVIQLDFNNRNMRTAMINALKYWVREFDIDGFRCDYATGPPVAFWNEVCAAVNTQKKVSWLAEGDNADYLSAFDCDYAWAFNDRLNSFGSGDNVSALVNACEELINNNRYAGKSRMIYLTNHDLNADHGTEFARYGANVYPLTVLLFTIYGTPLIYNGQEVGADKSMGLFETNPVPWTPVNTGMNSLIKKMIALKRTQPALEDGANRGAYRKYNTNNPQVYAYSRTKGKNEVLVMLNFSNSNVSFNFTGDAPAGVYTNYLESGTATFATQTAVSIPAKGYKVFVTEQTGVPPAPPEEGLTIRWRQASGTKNWENMHIYNYVNDADAECGPWPGRQVFKNADGWYSYRFTGTPGNIIWNNGDGGSGNQVDGPYGEEVADCFEITLTNFYPVSCPPPFTALQKTECRFALYPNPAVSSVFIDSPEPFRSISVKDMGGRLVLKDNVANRKQIDIHRLAPGCYIVEAQFTDTSVRRAKLLKKI
ncbi:MAG: starch-binding protein [Dysgonamonadaceae bacterium]|jgi:glycosidase|nr:starch-binding protein [Dysgonamonadaceae bacterium]